MCRRNHRNWIACKWNRQLYPASNWLCIWFDFYEFSDLAWKKLIAIGLPRWCLPANSLAENFPRWELLEEMNEKYRLLEVKSLIKNADSSTNPQFCMNKHSLFRYKWFLEVCLAFLLQIHQKNVSVKAGVLGWSRWSIYFIKRNLLLSIFSTF